MKPGFQSLAALLLLGVFHAAQAVENRVVFNMGYDFGGEELVDLQFANGGPGGIKTDEGFYINLGYLTVLTNALQLHSTIGFKSGTEEALNGELDWKSIPVRSALLLRTGNYRIGGGLVYHIDPVLKATGAAGSRKIKFANTAGFELLAIYAPYRFTYTETGYQLGLRYTKTAFEAGGIKADGSTIGLFFGFVF